MAYKIKNIVPRKLAENSQTTQYESVNVRTEIITFTVSNNSANAVLFSVNLVADGDSASADNLVISSRSISAGEVYRCPELVGQVLETGGVISTIASAASALVISATGLEISGENI